MAVIDDHNYKYHKKIKEEFEMTDTIMFYVVLTLVLCYFFHSFLACLVDYEKHEHPDKAKKYIEEDDKDKIKEGDQSQR